MTNAYPDPILLFSARIHERNPSWDPFTERHLHCIWFDHRLRPHPLTSNNGEEVRLLHPGHWNHEKGPDFLDAEWEVGGCRRRGDVEIHIRPLDWRIHGHKRDPAYENVGLHVTYESGDTAPGELPVDCTELSLKACLERRSHFFFDAIDPSAYPENVSSDPTGLRALFADRTEEEQATHLEAAGMERLRRKALRFQHRARSVGCDQALYAGLLRGLGYKQNADVAERLAGAIPADRLRALSGYHVLPAYAILLGVAGLLPEDPSHSSFPSWASVRDCWDVWWPHQTAFLGRALSREDWRLDGCRPGNHPLRRLWAAATWACSTPSLPSRVGTPSPSRKPGTSSHPWKRLQLAAPDGGEAVVGPARAGALFLNTVIPYWISTQDTAPEDDFWNHLPSEPLNALSKRAGEALFGPDVHPRLYRGGLRRQGLLQFHEDFGL